MKTLSEIIFPKELLDMLGRNCDVQDCTEKAEHFNQYTGSPEIRENLCEEHYIENNEEFYDKWADTEEQHATGN